MFFYQSVRLEMDHSNSLLALSTFFNRKAPSSTRNIGVLTDHGISVVSYTRQLRYHLLSFPSAYNYGYYRNNTASINNEVLHLVGGQGFITKYGSTFCTIMPVHFKIPICTFTFSDNPLLTPQDDI